MAFNTAPGVAVCTIAFASGGLLALPSRRRVGTTRLRSRIGPRTSSMSIALEGVLILDLLGPVESAVTGVGRREGGLDLSPRHRRRCHVEIVEISPKNQT